jgi:hypothetical protein
VTPKRSRQRPLAAAGIARPALVWLAVPAFAAAGWAAAQPSAAEPAAPPAQEGSADELFEGVSDRSLERVRYDCRSETDRRDVTLFANGTLRLRQGVPGHESMWLVELSPEERDAYLARLAGDSREEAEADSQTVGGDWVERCRFLIHLPGRLPEEYALGRFDSLSLALRRAVTVAEDLVARVDQSIPPEGATRLPTEYRPQVGDELRRSDGSWFRVDGYTSDGTGVELSAIEDPIVLYVATTELGREFVELRRRARGSR